MEFRITDEITEQDETEIFQQLLQYNLARIEDKNSRKLGIYLEDETGKKLAGLIGATHGNWLEIKYLWVDDALRGTGIGSKVLSQAESTAKARGCLYVFLDTFDFQAPGFYQKHGYQQVFVREQYPLSGKRYYFTKAL